jgi:hypothetical protein
MPGMKIRTKEQFYEFLQDVVDDNDQFREDRKRVNDLTNAYKDGNNCRRTLEIADIFI